MCVFLFFVFLNPDVGIGGSVLQPALGSMAGIGKLLLGTCVLLFFYTPGSPPSSGAHWSVKPSKNSRAHRA